MSKNRLVSSNNAVTVLNNGKPVVLSPKLNFTGDVAVASDNKGIATITFEVPRNQITEDLLDLPLQQKLKNYIPLCVNSGVVNQEGDANVLIQNATEIETVWNQPTLDNDGTLGQGELSVFSETEDNQFPLWQMFDKDSSTMGCFQSSVSITNSSFTFSTKEAIKINQLVLTFANDDYLTSFILQGSNDNNVWTNIATFDGLQYNKTNVLNIVNNIRYYHYHRIVGKSAVGSYSIAELSIGATYLAQVSPGNKFTPNFNTLGSVAITDEGDASNFSASNYLVIPKPFMPGVNSWEQKWVFTTNANVTSSQAITGDLVDRKKPCLMIINSKFVVYISADGTNWNIAEGIAGTHAVLGNTKYYVKYKFDGSKYSVSYSLDDKVYTEDISITSSVPINNNSEVTSIGFSYSLPSTPSSFNGVIHLAECSITMNGYYWWDCSSVQTLITFNDSFDRLNTYKANRTLVNDGNSWEAYSNAQASVGILDNQLQLDVANNNGVCCYRRSLENYSSFVKLDLQTNYTLNTTQATSNQSISFGIGSDNVLPSTNEDATTWVLGSGLELVIAPGTNAVYLIQDKEQLATASFAFATGAIYVIKISIETSSITMKIWDSTLTEPTDNLIDYIGSYTLIGPYLTINAKNSIATNFSNSLDTFSLRMTKAINPSNEETWRQPILTSDISEGVVTASSYQENCNPYKASNGIKSGDDPTSCFVFNNEVTGFWKWTLPYIVTITGINFYNIFSEVDGDKIIEGQFFADEGMTIPIGDAFSTSDIDWDKTAVSNILTKGIKTHTIYFNKTGGSGNSGIGDLEIIATIASQSLVFFNTREPIVITDADNNTKCLTFIEPLPVHQHTYNALIPKMTSYTTPAGTVTGVGGEVNATVAYWKAFLADNTAGSDTLQWVSSGTTPGGVIYTPPSLITPGTYRFKFETDNDSVPSNGQSKSITIVGIKEDSTQVDIWTKNNLNSTLTSFVLSPDIEITETFKSIYWRINAKWSTYMVLRNCQIYREDPLGTISFDNDKMINIGLDTLTGKAKALENVYVQKTQPNLVIQEVNFYNAGVTISSDNVASGFSGGKILATNQVFKPADKPWKIIYNIKTGSNISSDQTIQGAVLMESPRVPVIQMINGHFRISLTSNGTSWDIASLVDGTYSVLANTVYWIKLEFTGTQYIFSYSLDDKVYTEDIVIDSTAIIFQDNYNTLGIGNNLYQTATTNLTPWLGEIYLDNCSISVDNEIVWQPFINKNLPDNQVWINDSVYPYQMKISQGSQFRDWNSGVWVGRVTMQNGSIVSLFTNPYNYNGIGRKQLESWSQNQSWYKTFWEYDYATKTIRLWARQGSDIPLGAVVVNFFIPFFDSSYSMSSISAVIGDITGIPPTIVNGTKLPTSIRLYTGLASERYAGASWQAEGWAT